MAENYELIDNEEKHQYINISINYKYSFHLYFF